MPRPAARRGATMVETAVVLSTTLMFVLGAFDVGLAALRFNFIAEGARRVARAAIVRGELSSDVTAAWGPGTYEGTADDSHPLANVLREVIATLDPADVLLRVEWIDGGNRTDDRVRVEIRALHRPAVTWITGGQNLELRATSTMKIEH